MALRISRAVLVISTLFLLAAGGAAQQAVVQASGYAVLVLDPVTGSTTSTFAFPFETGSGGHTFGPDGRVYFTGYNSNSIRALDLTNGVWTRIAIDLQNEPMGDPLCPVLNAEAIGGPGLWLADGKNLTSGSVLRKNTVLVDIASGGIEIDAETPTPFLPNADAHPSPAHANEMWCVASGIARQRVTVYTPGRDRNYIPRIVPLPYPCGFDALMHEDGRLYCWTANSTSTLAPTGFMAVDDAGAIEVIPVQGIPWAGSGAAAVWNDPWEAPGMGAYVLNDGNDTVYKLDLATRPVVAAAVMTVPPRTIARRWDTGRELQESQLTSWRENTNGRRVLHLNFGPKRAGARYYCVPSAAGLASTPILEQGMEIWLEPDHYTMFALEGRLGYRPGGTLDANGEADVIFDLGRTFALDASWQAVIVENGQCVDFSNLVRCRM